MNRVRFPRAILALVLSIAFLGSGRSLRADDPHSFHAVYNNTFELSQDGGLPAGVLKKVIIGKGFNTLFGESTVEFVGSIDLNVSPYSIRGVTTFRFKDARQRPQEVYALTTGKVIPGEDPSLVRLEYSFSFTGGTGGYERIRGNAEVYGCAVFQTGLTGTASWSMDGRVRRRP